MPRFHRFLSKKVRVLSWRQLQVADAPRPEVLRQANRSTRVEKLFLNAFGERPCFQIPNFLKFVLKPIPCTHPKPAKLGIRPTSLSSRSLGDPQAVAKVQGLGLGGVS